MGSRLSEMKVLVCKEDYYPQQTYDYATEPRNYAKPAAIAGLGAAAYGGLALNNARLLPKRSQVALTRANDREVVSRARAASATSTASRAHASVPKAKLNPLRVPKLREANKLSDAARTARNAATTAERSAISARRAMGTVKARQRTGLKTGLAASGVGIGLTALAVRNAKQRRDAGY